MRHGVGRLVAAGALIAVFAGGCSASTPTTPAPAYPAGDSRWTWTEASAEDTALVDRLDRAWTDNDVAAIPSLYAKGAQLLVSWDDAPIDLAGITDTISGTPNSYERVGGVFMVTGSGLSLPTGSRYLFYPLVIHDDIFDCWLEVNGDNLIVNHWAGWKKV